MTALDFIKKQIIKPNEDGTKHIIFCFKTFKLIKKLTLINPEWFATIIKQTQIEFEGV